MTEEDSGSLSVAIDQYIDIRELSLEYTTIPCMECDDPFYVTTQFAYNHDTWYCDRCKPERLQDLDLGMGPDVTVRL